MPSKRWLIAQKHQLEYQLQKTILLKKWKELDRGFTDLGMWFEKSISLIKPINRSTRIVEIGSGPMGFIFFLKSGRRFALDPLALHLRGEFRKIQGKAVKIIEGMGEFLPISGRSFDFVILNNTIDHTDDPSSILKEIRRIMKEDGVLYIGVNIYPFPLRIASRIYEALSSLSLNYMGILPPIEIFRAHPCMFSFASIKSLLIKEGFKIIQEKSIKTREAKKSFRKRRRGLFWRIISSVAYTGEVFQAFCTI